MSDVSHLRPIELDEHFLRWAFDVARRALTHGNHPFGAVLVDKNRNVLIEAENGYARAMLAPLAELRAALFKEMRGRIKEDDSEVPRQDGPWLYYARHDKGGQHPVFCRVKGSGGPEEVLLDGDARTADLIGKAYSVSGCFDG